MARQVMYNNMVTCKHGCCAIEAYTSKQTGMLATQPVACMANLDNYRAQCNDTVHFCR